MSPNLGVGLIVMFALGVSGFWFVRWLGMAADGLMTWWWGGM